MLLEFLIFKISRIRGSEWLLGYLKLMLLEIYINLFCNQKRASLSGDSGSFFLPGWPLKKIIRFNGQFLVGG